MVCTLAVQWNSGWAAKPTRVRQLCRQRSSSWAADLQLADDRALRLEHLDAGRGQGDAFVREGVVAPEADPQVGALDPVERHAAVFGEAGGANGQGVDAAVDPAICVVDQVEDGADVLAPPHVLAAFGAVDAVRGRDLCLALGALDPLLGGLIAPDRGFGELLPEVAQVLDEAQRRVEDGQRFGLLAQNNDREALKVAVPLFDQLQLLVAKAQPVLFHLEVAVEVLPVGDLEREPRRGSTEPAGQQRLADLAHELERLLGLDDGVGAVDAPLLLEDLTQELGPAGRLHRRDLGCRRRARADANSKPAGLDLLARYVRVPEREHIPWIGRAQVRRT